MSRTTKEQPKSYKQLLIEARGLREQSGANAYRRAKLLVSVFTDQDFRADNNQLDDSELANELDQYVDDLALSFLQLKALLERFPSESEWSEGRLNRMYQELLEEARERRKARDTEKPVQERFTKKDITALREQLQRADVRVGEASLRAERAESEADQLRAKCAALESKVAHLEGRIAEMERTARNRSKREMQAA